MKSLLFSFVVLAAVTAPAVSAPRPNSAAVAHTSLVSMPEVLQYVQASRAIDAAVQSGVNVREYSRLVNELTAASSALDEVFEAKGQSELRDQLATVLRLHQRAKNFWNACTNDRAVLHSLIGMEGPDGLAAAEARGLLRDFPKMNQDIDTGGVLTVMSGRPVPLVYQDAVLSELWHIAGDGSKALRQKLR